MAKDGFSMSNREAMVDVTSNITATNADCGKVYVVRDAEASYVLTLPRPNAAKAGWNITCLSVMTAETGSTHAGWVPLTITGSGDNTTADFVGGVALISGSTVITTNVSSFWPKATGSNASGITFASGNVGSAGGAAAGAGADPDWLGGPGSYLTLTCDGINYLVRGMLSYSGSRHNATPFTTED